MPELQMPDIAGNFLSSYYTAQQKQQADADRQRNMQRQDRADGMAEQQFKWNMDDRQLQAARDQQEKFARLAQWADTPQKWAQATQMAESEGLKGASQIPFEQREAKLAGMLDVKTQLDQEWKRREYDLRKREVNSTIEARNRTAQGGGDAPGGKAPSGYEWTKGPSGSLELAPIKGGPADPAKLQPGELSKIRNSNKQIDELENSLNSYVANLNKTSSFGRLVDRGADVSRVETGHTDLLMQMKNLYELGVLNGPDYMLMTKIVEDPTSMMQVWRGNEGLTAQTDTVKSIINRARNLNNDRLQQAGVDAYRNPQQAPVAGVAGGGNASGIPTVTTKAQFDALPSGAVYMEDDGKRYTKP